MVIHSLSESGKFYCRPLNADRPAASGFLDFTPSSLDTAKPGDLHEEKLLPTGSLKYEASLDYRMVWGYFDQVPWSAWRAGERLQALETQETPFIERGYSFPPHNSNSYLQSFVQKPKMSVKPESTAIGHAVHVERNNQKQPIDSGDIATKLVDNYTHDSITSQQDRECLRRIDLVLMPVMFISFARQYLDKACLTGAALYGILVDLDLVKL